jgi:hypothetical protein
MNPESFEKLNSGGKGIRKKRRKKRRKNKKKKKH